MPTRQRALFAAIVFVTLVVPATAGAEFVQIYGNGHGSYLGGDANRLSYFENNDAGLGYGFTLGAEVFMVDAFLDANFHPAGSQWNQIGLGFDIDLIPGSPFVEPTGQIVYFFGKQADGSDAVSGLFGRIGVQAGLSFAKVLYAGVEGYTGYVVSLPDVETGFVYIAGLYAGVRFGI